MRAASNQHDRSKSQQQQQHAGRTPNLYWRAITTDELRAQPRFSALPRAEDVHVYKSRSYRYIRQHTQLWKELHQGVLTTGYLKSALGFHENRAANFLGHKHLANHGSLVAAYKHLLCKPVDPVTPGSTSEDAAVQLNEQLRTSFNKSNAPVPKSPATGRKLRSEQYVAYSGLALHMVWGNTQEAAAVYCLLHLFPESQVQEVGLLHVPATNLPLTLLGKLNPCHLPGFGASPDALIVHTIPIPAAALQDYQALLERHGDAHGGAAGGRPHAAVAEAAGQLLREGLARVECVGAVEPDGGWAKWEEAVDGGEAGCVGVEAGSGGQGEEQGGGDERGPWLRGQEARDVSIGLEGLLSSLEFRTLEEVVEGWATAAFGPGTAGCCDDGHPGADTSCESVRATSSSKSSSHSSSQHTPGSASSGSTEEMGTRSSTGASNDSSSRCSGGHANGNGAAVAGSASSSSSGEADAGVETAEGGSNAGSSGHNVSTGTVLDDRRRVRSGAAAGTMGMAERSRDRSGEMGGGGQDGSAEAVASASQGAAGTGVPGEGVQGGAAVERGPGKAGASGYVYVQVREVVEVKNHCPFKSTSAKGVARRRGKTGGHKFSVVEGHPKAKVEPQWVPQLQLHMLASGCLSALLVSRTVSGVHVFRMYRDDEYLRLVLGTVSKFCDQYVQQGRPPPENMLYHDDDYHRLLHRTKRLAWEARLVARLYEPIVGPGADENSFW